MSDNDYVEDKALEFAKDAHRGQLRKYTNEPYINHPMAVSEVVMSVNGDHEMIAASLLHDTVEDTDVTLDDISKEFGEGISMLVYWLTNKSKPSDGNRKTRKNIDLLHISLAPPRAKTIKLADLIDNTKTIHKFDPEFWKVYREEKLKLLEVLKDGDKKLWELAKKQCEEN